MIVTRKKFCELSGIKISSLGVYISNKKVFVNKKGMIDCEHPENKTFLESREKKIENRNLNTEKKLLEIAKMEGEISLNQLKRQRLEANYLPAELMLEFCNRLGKYLIVSFKNEFVSILTDLWRKKILNDSQRENLHAHLVTAINSAGATAKTMTKKDIEAMVEKYESKELKK